MLAGFGGGADGVGDCVRVLVVVMALVVFSV